jgi:phage I-like protein
LKELAAQKEPDKQPISVENSGKNSEMGGNTMPENKDTDDKAKIASLEAEIVELKAKLAESEEKAAKAEPLQEKLDLVLSEKQEIAKELADLKAKNTKAEKEQIIEKALSEGRITPKNRSKWEQAFDKDPEGTKALLETQDPVVDFTTKGTGAGGEETDPMSAEEKKVHEAFGHSEEDVKKYGGKS